MKRSYFIVICSLFVACSGPTEPASYPKDTVVHDRGMDTGSRSSDLSQKDQDPQTSLPKGKKIHAFSEVLDEKITHVDLSMNADKAFLAINHKYLLFTDFSKPDLTLFYSWPEGTLPLAPGTIGTHIVVGSDRVWFGAKKNGKSVALYGAKYVPQEPGQKIFGDPVVVFDAGPGNAFGGVSIWKESAILGIDAFDAFPSRILIDGKDIEPTTIEIPGFSRTRKLHQTQEGAAYIHDHAIWKISVEKQKVNKMTVVGNIRDMRSTSRSYFLRTDSGLAKIAIDCFEPCTTQKLTEGFSPEHWDASDSLVVWNEGKIIRSFQKGKLLSVAESNEPILSILVKNSDIYWATQSGLFILK